MYEQKKEQRLIKTTSKHTHGAQQHHHQIMEGESESKEEEVMHAAMALLPDELTAAYREACRFVPELVEKESDPRWFLR
jgi:hypothetical protein